MLPWRAAEVRDVGMDVAGILIGAALYRAVQWLRGRAGAWPYGGRPCDGRQAATLVPSLDRTMTS